MKKIICFLSLLLLSYACLSQTEKSQKEALHTIFIKLRNTDKAFKSNLLINKIIKLDYPYDSIVSHIKSNTYYSTEVETGFLEWNTTIDSINHDCYLFIPTSYSVNQKYPVSFILHGAVMSPNPNAVTKYINKNSYKVDSLDKIIVYPAGWIQSPWWHERQVENLSFLVRKLKKVYNIDENNVHLTGISDGGTGIIYQASLNINPWAGFRPYISNPLGLDGLSKNSIYIKNLGNKPFLFISSEKDQLFPPVLIESFLKEMDKANNSYEYHQAKGFKHEISWLPLFKDTIENFNSNNPRNPYPSEINWVTDDIKYGRNHWVILDKLVSKPKIPMKDYPVIKSIYNEENKIPGILNVNCEENKISVETINVKQYTLLLSPEQFDFNKKFQIYTNNHLSFKGKVEKDIQTLLKWYHKDLDRTMLFGNEVSIKVKY